MAWKVVRPMDQKMEFLVRWQKGERITDLCHAFDISRKTGHKLIKRFEIEGIKGLEERSRRPHSSPAKTPQNLEDAVIGERTAHPSWGARKIKAILQRKYPSQIIPAASVIHSILSRHGLVISRHRTGNFKPKALNLKGTDKPGALWCADFKGQIQLQDKSMCFPLTITDYASRYLITCKGLTAIKYHDVRPIFEEAFSKHGVPAAIRTDNGAPFASSNGLLGFSHLSAWWVSLGIKLQKIDPGKPQQNGRHERMHLTLKIETARPSEANLGLQQQRFDVFRREYNHIRPHEALGMESPGRIYERSQVKYDPRPLVYPLCDYSKRVTSKGYIEIESKSIYLSEALRGYSLGLTEIEPDIWVVSFSYQDLGFYDKKENSFSPAWI